MTVKNVTMEQLLEFTRKIYADACFGHLDLLDSYCEINCEKFFNSLKIANPMVIDSVSNFEINSDDIVVNYSQPHFIISNDIYDGSITITSNTGEVF